MIGTRPIKRITSDALGKYQKMIKRFPRRIEDWLFRATYDHQGGRECLACDKGQLVNRVPRTTDEPHIHHGLIASGNFHFSLTSYINAKLVLSQINEIAPIRLLQVCGT
ncbi:hypothetical protein BGW36DRAFT_392130 [Talaromyces proteolyticus]|uniref:Uncharacterized protein n=1 Tax=Talaromyces proteolyticus TaxID=1131652 RepID=A0AAD4KD33_9EURO|nr:uncharacterized protein BGW36DRAFT_392130 [Talaromyces proteolyticus]KAH8688761.1 hypothetical protein BGW36DRAFT_392130 [Talaromyces proteolyticus]